MWLVRRLVRLLLRIFYRRIEVVGLEHVPARGPLLVVANHGNGGIDGTLVMTTIPRRLAVLAKAPLFRNPVVGALLRHFGAIPVHRPQDATTPRGRPDNAAMFSDAFATLSCGGGLLIFPEGTSHTDPMLRPVRTGAARIALGTGARDLTILPVGLTYDAPRTFRGGHALVAIGEPLVAGAPVGAGVDDEEAVRALTERIAAALRRQIVEAEDRDTLRLADLVERLWRDETSEPSTAARVEWVRRALNAARYVGERDPARLAAFRRAVEEYARDVGPAGDVEERYPASAVLRYTLRESAALGLSLPLALVGLALNVVPYRLTGRLVRGASVDEDMEASFKLGIGAALFPLAWSAEAVIVWLVGGPVALLAFLVVLIPSTVLALAWDERRARVRRDVGSFTRFLLRPDLHARLVARRRALIAELRALADAVPPEILTGEARS
jgi:1-acyl-sn-glycerol-3-phosphate acyltransferase